jgi:N-acetylglucosaminyl-diphospho-decaprenol L-rhamnosyltransferase
MSAPGRVDVVLVNWNTGPYLARCLRTLADSRGVSLARIVVVDNASDDGSADDLARDLPADLPLVTIRNEENRGFAAACNQGAALGDAAHLLFLNPDTEVYPDTLVTALAALEEDPASRAICGGRLQRPDGTFALSASRFPTLGNVVGGVLRLPGLVPRHLRPDELRSSRTVDQVIGAFFLVRRDVFEALGGFDERYFVYYEEVDLARRALAQGWTSYFAHEARLVHVENVSARRSGGKALFYSLRSRTLYARRHWPRWQQVLLVVFTLLIELPLRILRAGPGVSPTRAQAWRAARDYCTFLVDPRSERT